MRVVTVMRDSENEQPIESAIRESGGVDHADYSPLPDENPEELDAADEDEDENIEQVVNLSEREQCVCNFAIRRAIEQRLEQKALDHDLDYLDCDLDD